ncbi:hypothetical protein E6C27_scaffold558G00020 [Cucumis melo var. makuwa]|uniref:Transmembrane protein n=1 Tax=Cucumis melo var. makuwa TaxID=1194695 RepID=A0A5A7T872_CUCMM|nr:hypothetical protein E6C27_scaffold558G00020 [Cucumis melo var. makuwa]
MAAHRLNFHLAIVIIGLLILVGHVTATITSDHNKINFYRRFGRMIYKEKNMGGYHDGVFGGSLTQVPAEPGPSSSLNFSTPKIFLFELR